MDFNFFMPTKTISGKGAFKKSAGVLKNFGSRCLIITGGHSAEICGALKDAESVLKEAGIEYVISATAKPNPLLSDTFNEGAQARKFRAEFILGIGGGSAMDSAKAAAVFAGNPTFTPEDIFKRSFTKALPIILVGTTAGTGSEVTRTSILTIDGKNIKKSVNSDCCYAKISFCDPIYTESCPYDITVSTALDALSHAVEGFYGNNGGDIARNCALNAVNLLWPNLLWLSRNVGVTPTEPEREQLYYGSLWAGFTLNLSGTGFPHPAGYPLSSEHNIPHGKACAVFLPDFIKHNAPASDSLTKLLFSVLKCDMETFCSVVSKLAGLEKLRLSAEEIERYSKEVEGRRNLTNTIVPSTADEIKTIYEKLFLR